MKSGTILTKKFPLKTGLILFFTLAGFTGINMSCAQSIVGKWNQLKIKTYYTPAGAKANDNHTESEINVADIGTSIFVFYDNGTYRMETTAGNSKAKTYLGTWSMSGKVLTMQLLAQQEDPKDNPPAGTQPEKTVVSFHDNVMEWTSAFTDDENISKIVLTLAKD